MNQEKEIKRLRKTIKDLTKIIKDQAIEIQSLREKVRELEGKQENEKQKPDFIKEPVKSPPRKSGQKKGHKGYSRHIPERIDEVKSLDMKRCPNCGNSLSAVQEVRERVITDIEINIRNTKYQINRRYCKKCKRVMEPEVGDALPNARFSLRFMLLIMLLKIGLRIPSQSIIDFFGIFGLKISDGEIYNILYKLENEFGDYYEELVIEMREASHKHIDETSWGMGGLNYWMWDFVNRKVAVYKITKRRNSDTPVNFLGNQEGKFMTTDRFCAYNVVKRKTGISQQVCWTHVLRNAMELAEKHKEAEYIFKRLKYIFRKAKEGVPKEKLLHWIDLMATSRTYESTEVIKFLKSISRNHREDLFRFVDNPEVAYTNNPAERGLRHPVVMRKISGGSRSEKGAETTAKLLSVVQTMKMQEGNIMDNLVGVLQKGK